MTQSEFDASVQRTIDATLARVRNGQCGCANCESEDGGRTLAGNTPHDQSKDSEELLQAAAIAQAAYWDALSSLERSLGFEINTDELGELDAYTVDDLISKFDR